MREWKVTVTKNDIFKCLQACLSVRVWQCQWMNLSLCLITLLKPSKCWSVWTRKCIKKWVDQRVILWVSPCHITSYGDVRIYPLPSRICPKMYVLNWACHNARNYDTHVRFWQMGDPLTMSGNKSVIIMHREAKCTGPLCRAHAIAFA